MTKRPSLSASMKELKEDVAPDPVALVAKARTATAPVRAATREGMKRLLVPVTPDLHKRLKLAAVTNDKTLESIAREALESYLLKLASK